MNSNQSAVIFGFITVAFVVYITLKGELPIYAGLLLLSPAQSGQQSASASNASSAQASSIISSAIALAG